MDHTFQYRAHIQEIPHIRKDLELVKEELMIPDYEIKQLQLIIEELFSNIIRFAFLDEEKHMVEIGLTKRDIEIDVEIIDDGIPFNPLEFDAEPSYDPAVPEAGRMGLTLIRAFSSQITYNRKSGKNYLMVTKRIKH